MDWNCNKDELDQLSMGAKMILAAVCTQRHAVNYHTFAGGTGSRRSKQFDTIFDAIWRDIGFEQLSTDQLKKLEFRAEQLEPDTGPYAGYAGYAAEALMICCATARLHGDGTHVVYIAKRAFESIRGCLRDAALPLPDGRPRPLALNLEEHRRREQDLEAMVDAHPLTLDEHRRQERDLNDVKRMVEERCLIVDIVERLEKRLKAESKAEALIPIRSGIPIDLTTVNLEKHQKRPPVQKPLSGPLLAQHLARPADSERLWG